jgi:hypothetical protein
MALGSRQTADERGLIGGKRIVGCGGCVGAMRAYGPSTDRVRGMVLTTPAPPLDVVAAFGELAGMSRTAVRLHPRRGEVGRCDSSLGGPLLWPRDEPWPSCDDAGHTP